MNLGRFCFVAFPLILTIGAIISFLIATLSGIAHDSLYIFRVDLRDLTLNEDTLKSLADNIDIDLPGNLEISDVTDNFGKEKRADGLSASDLGLGREYEITLWGYCEIKKKKGGDGEERDCSDGEFDWATKHLRDDFINDLGKSINVEIKLPDEIDKAIDVFSTVNRYAEIAFIVALVVLGVELFFGIFATCTRVMSCLTWIIGLAAIVICVLTAGLATGMGAVVVGAIEASAKVYGVRASLNTNFLACIWIGAAFAIVASLFWLISICCCKPDHRSGKKGTKYRDGGDDNEKLMPTGSYYPIGANDHEMTPGNYQQQFQPNNGMGYSHGPPDYTGYSGGGGYNMGGGSGRQNNPYEAYEPYSHRG